MKFYKSGKNKIEMFENKEKGSIKNKLCIKAWMIQTSICGN